MNDLKFALRQLLKNRGFAAVTVLTLALTGHTTRAVNTHYTHLQVATLKNAVSSLPLFTSGSGKEDPRAK